MGAAHHRSGFEKRIRDELDAAGVAYEYESQTFPLFIPVTGYVCTACGESKWLMRKAKYTPDFFFGKNTLIVEAKGKFTAKDRKIALAFKKYFPQWDYRMVFMRDNWLTKAKKKRYTDWCRDNNIPSAVGSIPEEWYK